MTSEKIEESLPDMERKSEQHGIGGSRDGEPSLEWSSMDSLTMHITRSQRKVAEQEEKASCMYGY